MTITVPESFFEHREQEQQLPSIKWPSITGSLSLLQAALQQHIQWSGSATDLNCPTMNKKGETCETYMVKHNMVAFYFYLVPYSLTPDAPSHKDS